MMAKPFSLDQEILDILACPCCKTPFSAGVEPDRNYLACPTCDAVFPVRENGVLDFRLTPPAYAQPLFHEAWSGGQREYERWAKNLPEDAEYYRKQIEQDLRTIYAIYDYSTIKGIVLDVGGNDGRLRHFLESDVVYVCLDPYLNVREDLIRRGRLEAYPVLAEPYNFICGRAEQLPFIHRGIDCIRCNSVLDHLWDPFLALREMYRVLKPGGRLLLGVNAVGAAGETIGKRIKSIAKILLLRPADRHLWHPTREQLRKITELTGFQWLGDNYIDETKSLEIVLGRTAGREA